MTLNEALTMYNLPYAITETITGNGYISYKLIPTGSGATIQRLKIRLDDLMIATGQDLELITSDCLIIRSRTKQAIYNYFDYNGYIDYEDSKCPFIVGFNNNGIILDNIDNARHLLIAGTTGSGKSVFLHNLIFTFACNPHNRLFLVDCKQVEFDVYNGHAYIVNDVFGEKSAAKVCYYLTDLMDDRYKQMKNAGVNDFEDFKKIYPDEKRHILVIDELSDLIGDKKARNAIIPELLRLAQKGRAAGVHIILATQRPDSTVINGTLKGNMPTRMAFKTVSRIDSQIILDQAGAEKLAGNGDGLYMKNGAFRIERVQTPYLSLDDIRKTS